MIKPSRRRFVQGAAALSLGACASTPPAPARIDQLELVAEGLFRPEGVVATRDGRIIVSSSAGACTVLYPDGTRREIGVAPHANGLAMDRRGRVIIANYGLITNVPGGLQRLDLESGESEVLADAINGRALVASNAAAIGPDDAIYCTHPHWADPTNVGAVRATGFVYRVDRDGAVSVACDGIRGANGLCFSADFAHLFVAQTAAGNIVRLRREENGRYGDAITWGPQLGEAPDEARVADLRAMSPERRAGLGHPDGLALDQAGNLWVTLPFANSVAYVTPDRRMVRVLSDADGAKLNMPTNLAFGGPDLRDLYIASMRNNQLWKLRVETPGLPLPHWAISA